MLLAVLASVRQQCPDAELHLLSTADGPLLTQAKLLGVQTAVLPLPATLSTLGDSQLNGKSKVGKWLTFLQLGFRALPATQFYLRQLRKFIHDLRPTLIHSNGIKTHLLLGLAGVRSVPVLWHVHDFYGSRPLVPTASPCEEVRSPPLPFPRRLPTTHGECCGNAGPGHLQCH